MRNDLILAVAAAIALSAADDATAAQPTTDPAIVWTIYPGYSVDATTGVVTPCAPSPLSSGCLPTNIVGDGAPYSNTTGAFNCVIHISGTNDATCGIKKPTSRTMTFNLSNQVAYFSLPQPAWATSGAVQGNTSFVNVWDILWSYGIGTLSEYDFTTRLTMQVPNNGKSTGYRLAMDADSPIPTGNITNQIGSDPNDPYQTALVHVHHCPDTKQTWSTPTAWCPTNHKESWWVYPDSQTNGASPGTTQFLTVVTGANVHQVGALIEEGTSTPPILGQYSMPFLFQIELQ